MISPMNMDNNTPQQNQIPNQPTENKSSIGGIMGTIIILAIIVLGALYFWGKRIEEARTNSQLNSQASVVETLPPIEIHVTATSTATTTLPTTKKK